MFECPVDSCLELSENPLLEFVRVQVHSQALGHFVPVLIEEKGILRVEELMRLKQDALLLERKHLVEIFDWHFLRSDGATELDSV